MSAYGEAAIGGGIGLITGAINNIYARKREQEARLENYRYNELSAINADQRTRALYADLQSPEAMLKQYNDAGLSPSLMFGNGGSGGGAVPSGAQGEGASGVAPQTYAMDAIQGAQLAVMTAQARKLNAEADTEEGTNERGQAEISKLMEEKGAISAEKYYKQSLTTYQNIINYISDETKDLKVEQIGFETEKLEYETVKTQYEALRAGMTYDFEKQTYNDRVKQVSETLAKTIAEKNLTKEQTRQVSEAIEQAWKGLDMQKWANEIADAKNEIDWRKFEDEWKNRAQLFMYDLGFKIKALNVNVDMGIMKSLFPMLMQTATMALK